MKKTQLFLFFTTALILAGIGIAFWWNNSLTPVGASPTLQRFVILKGSGASLIAKNLTEQKLIKDPLAFRIYTTITGTATQIPPGEYELSPNMSIPKIIETFLKGPTEVWVTIPEGLRREEIAEKFVTGMNLTGETANEFRSEFLNLTSGKEGYLFPDTYLVPKDATADIIAKLLSSTFESKVGEINNQTLTLASIIERETLTTSERPVVAGILVKRARAGWALNADAAVQYARDNINCKNVIACDYWKPLTRNDIDSVNSPYNTYKYPGFPPGPIANPGLTSINAAKNPQSTDYWYYLHDLQGGIHYAETLEEHNENIVKYLQ